MNKPLRLLVLTHNYPRFQGDFAGVFLSVLNRHLPEHGIEPIVLAPHYQGAEEDEVVEGVRVIRFRYADDPARENLAYQGQMHKLVLGSVTGIFRFHHFLNCFRRAAKKIIEEENIQVVAGHWLIPAGLVMKTIRAKYDLPMILSSHGTDIRLMQKYSKMAFKYLKGFCRSLKSWTVVSSFLKEAIVELEPSFENLITVMPLPHDENIFHRVQSVQRDNSLVTAVTRFTEQKRVDQLITAFALVAEHNSVAKLQIFGAGPLKNQTENLINKLGLKDRISLFKPVEQTELRRIYNQSAVVVLNSFQEGFGLALSEAMLCGAAVIGTASGGITDIIEHEKTGLLVEVENPPALAKALARLLDDHNLRARLAGQGHRFASETYSSKALAGRYAQLVKNCLSDN